jgi:hypothetical protein
MKNLRNLSDKSNERVRDTILLKKLKTILRESSAETSIFKIFQVFLLFFNNKRFFFEKALCGKISNFFSKKSKHHLLNSK